jgi:hypothetical protein
MAKTWEEIKKQMSWQRRIRIYLRAKRLLFQLKIITFLKEDY